MNLAWEIKDKRSTTMMGKDQLTQSSTMAQMLLDFNISASF